MSGGGSLCRKQSTNIVFGGGTGGKVVGWTLAKKGERTAVVERRWIGGSCHNVACMPSKNVIHSAKVASLLDRAAEFGIETQPFVINMEGVRKRKREMVDRDVQAQLATFENTGTELILGEGRLVGPKTLEVKLNDGGTRRLTTDRLFLNLGTHAKIPHIPGLVDARPMIHVEPLELDRVPSHLIVLGGGFVGLELGQAMRRFGSRVTVIERGPQLASSEDQDVGEALLELFHDEGIEVLLRAHLTNVSGVSGENIRTEIQYDGQERTVDASHLLVAAGRTVNTRGIGLEEAGVELDDKGYIKVNERLETTAPGVWAIGECAGSPKFTHVSYDDFTIIRDNLSRRSRTTRNRLIPFCVFTDPELARVGLNESEARTRGIEYRVARMPAKNVFRTMTLPETRGFLKMLIDEHSDRILGFTAFITGAGGLMAVVQTAMLAGAPFTTLRDAIFAHPTLADGLSDSPLLGEMEVREKERTEGEPVPVA